MREIITNKPVPELLLRGMRSKYPWRKMEPGDAFKFPDDVKIASARTVASQKGLTLKKKFTVRLTEDGIWCWRVDGLEGYND